LTSSHGLKAEDSLLGDQCPDRSTLNALLSNAQYQSKPLPPHNCETRQGSIVTSTNTQLKERRFLHGLKATVSAPNI